MDNMILIGIFAILTVLAIIALIVGLVNSSKINSIMEYSEDGNLVDNLDKYYDSIRDMQKKFKSTQSGAMADRISACETKVNMTLSKIGIVNFNAFDDVHGNQSFAIAVLNQYNDGFVITSLYGSSSSNSYVRTITNGKSTTKLIAEEQQAIEKAMGAQASPTPATEVAEEA